MAQVGQLYYRVLDTTSGTYITSSNLTPAAMYDLGANLVTFYSGAKQFNKLGIQAPPGTKALINNKEIMVGRTGIYELDEDIAITALRFERPRKYIKDEEASKESEKKGTQEMIAADEKRQSALETLREDYPVVPMDEDDENFAIYWDRYEAIQNTYIEEYELGLNDYAIGKNGIYVLPDPANTESEANYEDLYNVIIDFVYE